MPDGTAFGLDDTDLSDFSDESLAEAPVAPDEEEEQPADPALDSVEEPAQEAQDEETEGEEEAELYAGKFQTPEALESAYMEVQAFANREVAARQRLEQQIAEQQRALQIMGPLVQRAVAAQDPEYAEQLAAQAALQRQLQPIVQQQVAPLQQQLAVEQARNAAMGTLQEFYATHPDVEPRSQADEAVAQTLRSLKGGEVDSFNAWELEVAYEAAQDPALYSVLMTAPHLGNTLEGMQVARQMAGQQQVAERPSRQPKTVQRKGPHIETGGSGAPVQAAPGDRPADEFDEALQAFRSGVQSPLFGNAR
jgi:hypothetical protein